MAISPITQTISTIPTAGHRGVDVQNVFVTKQEAFQDALTGTFVGQINTVKDQINTVVVGINNSITEIEDSVSEAKQSEDKAKVSEDNAKQSEDKAKVSEDNAKVSELNAQAYAGVINPETFVNSKFSIGFIDHTTSTISCVGDIVRLTFTQDINIYKYAVPYEFTQGTILEINVSTHTKGFWIILNELTMALEIKTTTPNFDSDILVSWIYRNATDGIIWRNDERHLCSRNVEWHKSHHWETGAVLISGGNLNYTLNNPSSLALGINTPIRIADGELFFDITHSDTPTGYFDQVLNSNALIPILYLDNNLEYKSITRTDPSCLYLYNGTRAVYNDTTLGTLVTVPDNSYICYWLLYTTDYLVPVKLVLGTQAHTNISDAELEAFENLGLSMPEVIGVSKIILHINNTYTQNPAKAVLHSVYYLIKNENVLNPSFIPSNHNSLIGRSETDQHPISSITGLQEALNGKLAINGKVQSASIADSATTAATCSGNAATATTAATCSGNAATATKLATARTINGVVFDGTDGILVPADRYVISKDQRALKPADLDNRAIGFYFSSLGGMTGASNAVYGDLITLNSYSDSTGGKENALFFNKSTMEILHYQSATYGAATWGTPKTLAYTNSNITGNSGSATKLSTDRNNYKGVTDTVVAGELMWKAFGNNHTIFDASSSITPDGVTKNNTNPDNAWAPKSPTLMGYNGSGTYGVRVDSSRYADQLYTARTISLSGAVTGSGVFNGSANINIVTSSTASSVDEYALVTVAANAGTQYKNTNAAGSSLQEVFFQSNNQSLALAGYSFGITGRSLTGTWFVQGTISNNNNGTNVALAKRIA